MGQLLSMQNGYILLKQSTKKALSGDDKPIEGRGVIISCEHEIAEGDEILFNQNLAKVTYIDSTEYLYIHEKDVIAVI